jgi:Tol biopolymer transport system component
MGKRLASGSVLGLVVACVIAIPQARSGTFAGANGRIAFVYNPDGIPRVATARPDGADLRVLIPNRHGNSGGFLSSYPQWSPDGGRVLTVRNWTNPPHLLVANADGSGITDLGAFTGSSASWRPDGGIVYAESGNVYVADLASLGSPTLLIEDAREPAWSPQGNRLAFTRSTEGVRHIWVADGDGTGATQLTAAVKTAFSGQSNPVWSPDSSTIAYQSGEFGSSSVHVGVVNTTGTPVETEITTVGRNADPVWSPDGTKIGFWSSRGSGFWTMAPDGGNQVRSFTWAGSGFDWQPLSVTLQASRSKLTFGSTLTLTAHVVPAPSSGIVRIYRIPAGTKNRTLINEGAVDVAGNRTITLQPAASATYLATWLGDGTHTLSEYSSDIRKVLVRVRITGELRGGYATRDGFRLYHFTSACPERAERCPISVFRVVPSHAGKSIVVKLQEWRNGAWRTNVERGGKLNDQSRLGIVWIYPDLPGLVVGHRFRVRGTFTGDIDHSGAGTSWLRFKITT